MQGSGRSLACLPVGEFGWAGLSGGIALSPEGQALLALFTPSTVCMAWIRFIRRRDRGLRAL
jgi:hypothetical protein